MDNVLLRAVELLVESRRVFVFGNRIVLEAERHDGEGLGLLTLCTGTEVAVGAEDLLSNVLLCEDDERQFPVHKSFADVLLRSELPWQRLSRIRHYATRPVFDRNFALRGPGWHPEEGILVHGPHVEPALPAGTAGETCARERLPFHLRNLLRNFCFATDADLVNTLGLMLTGLLANHFVATGKAVAVIDGNQPNLGKTLLARSIGVLLDGLEPHLTAFNPDDDELQKRICATLRGNPQSVLLLDNAKIRSGTYVNSPTIEANSTAPEIVLRILGRSDNLRRPNDLLWVLTMNDARASPDLVSRCLPIRLAHEGDPAARCFVGPDPIDYARTHRLDLLAELAGLVIHWSQRGRPPGTRAHRLRPWAAVIGGILATAGFPEFLANADAAAVSFNVNLDRLAALAEAVVTCQGPFVVEGGESP